MSTSFLYFIKTYFSARKQVISENLEKCHNSLSKNQLQRNTKIRLALPTSRKRGKKAVVFQYRRNCSNKMPE